MPVHHDRIHLANGTLFLDGTCDEKTDFCVNRLPVNYNPNAPQPVKWLYFLSQLLEPEDILTLQELRIVKAQKEGRHAKVKSLQWLLTHSFYAKALAIKRVTENRGKNTAGVDHEIWREPQAKFNAISKLYRRGYSPQPLRRVYILKKNGKKRPLSIPTMCDRAMQTLYKFSLEPLAETTADPTG